MADLQGWENGVLNQVLDTDGVLQDKGQCSQVPISWAERCFPGVPWGLLLPEANAVIGWAGRSTKYFSWVPNNAADPNQLPLPGDIPVFGATPAKGYTMKFVNPYGHSGVIKSASTSGYTLIEQNEPLGSGVHDSSYAWSLRPCLGWFRPVTEVTPVAPPQPSAPVPHPVTVPVSSANVGKQLVIPAGLTWWTYPENGPYDTGHHSDMLNTKKTGQQIHTIVRDLGNGLYVIETQSFGRRAVWATAPLRVQ